MVDRNTRVYKTFRAIIRKAMLKTDLAGYIDFQNCSDGHCNCLQMIYETGPDILDLCKKCENNARDITCIYPLIDSRLR